MANLLFNRTTRPSARWAALIMPAAVLAVPCARLLLTGHPVAAACTAGGLLLLVTLLGLLYRYTWTSVGPEGITYFPGHRRARTLPWSEISWIGVRTIASKQGAVRTVRVTTGTGKRFNLPCVTDSFSYPDPDFDRKVEQITTYWQAHTDEGSRIDPGPSRGDARLNGLNRFNGNPLSALRRLARTGWCQAAFALLFAGLMVHSLSEIPGDRGIAAAYRHKIVCPAAFDLSTLTAAQLSTLTAAQLETLAATPQPAGCINHEVMTVDSTVIGSNPLAESRLFLSSANGAYEVDFGAANTWLRSLHPNDPVYANYVANGEITDVGSGSTLWHDTESPAYLQNTDIADAVSFGSIALLMGAWSAALLRRRYSGVSVGFRWWVTCSLPAVFVTILVANHLEQDPSPLVTGYFTVPALALAAGLALALGLSRVRRRRSPTAEPQAPAEWSAAPPKQ